MGAVGSADRARLDQYFTGLRQLESQLDVELTKPEPLAACHPVTPPTEDPRTASRSTRWAAPPHDHRPHGHGAGLRPDARVQHDVQPRFASTIKAGYEQPHHPLTHEEVLDQSLGYQPTASWFTRQVMEAWVYFVDALPQGQGRRPHAARQHADPRHDGLLLGEGPFPGRHPLLHGGTGRRARQDRPARGRQRNHRRARRLHRAEGLRRRRERLGHEEQRHFARDRRDARVTRR